ncbi:MAG: hypothetical protein LCH46_13650 [Proteobacteria bacterium]|nr:hypothetical protein [Pseudomonadota bacterium]
MRHHDPHAFRIGHYEFFWELAASPLRPSTWFRPSSMSCEAGGTTSHLFWCGPLHVAYCKLPTRQNFSVQQ